MLSPAHNDLLTRTGADTPLGRLYRRYWIPALLSTDGHEIHIYVPADDTHSWRYDLGFKQVGPVTEDDWHRRKQIGPDYGKLRNFQNDYLIDRQAQKQASYTGIEDFINHDGCVTETMGAIYDRSQEHLGVSDAAVIAVRRYLLKAVQSFQNGGAPPHRVDDPAKNNFSHACSIAEVIPVAQSWRQHFPQLRHDIERKAG